MAKDAESQMGFESPLAERPSGSGAEVGAGSGPAELTIDRSTKSWAWKQEQAPLKVPWDPLLGIRERRRLTEDAILVWADAHHAATGDWPRTVSGAVRDAPFDDTWRNVHEALRTGLRGLPGGSSLRRLLLQKRGGGLTLTLEQILAWADAHHAATESWPTRDSGQVIDAPRESWANIDALLKAGGRGLAGGLSLIRLLTKHRGARNRRKMGPLSIGAILAWADAHHAATSDWPRYDSGKVIDAPRESWSNLNYLLRTGGRGLAGGLSLCRILAMYRSVRGGHRMKPLSIAEILAWADAHHEATGRWPAAKSGPVRDAPYDLTWRAIDEALTKGRRGLPEGLSLGRLLAEHRALRPPLSLEQILAWADTHHEATGGWPTVKSGPVKGASRESWAEIDSSLRKGCRGLPGGQALGRVLAAHCDVRRKPRKPLKIEQILAWADAHHVAHGRWPTLLSGPIDGVPGETWSAVDTALITGRRGLRRATTLARLLVEHRGLKARNRPPRLTLEQVQAWADAFHAATGCWPTALTGAVLEAPAESWRNIEQALRGGLRGLPRGLSLADLRAQKADPCARTVELPRLTRDQILAWADAHHEAHGRWPTRRSGRIPNAPGETWEQIATALTRGERGLRRGTSLTRLLATHRGVKRMPLDLTTIQAWANHHRRTTGSWPRVDSGAVTGAPGESWVAINDALKVGHRGLPGGLSLAKLFGPRTLPQRHDLTVEQVLVWAQAHHAAHGRWPGLKAGPIPQAPGESWANIYYALKRGRRGLPGGLTLAKFIAQYRNATPNPPPNAADNPS